MIRDPKRGISAGICSRCGEEVPFIATFCPVCGHRFVYAQCMPDIETWLRLSNDERSTVYQRALKETLDDIRNKGDWRIGCVNRGELELSNLIRKPTIQGHKIRKSSLFPAHRSAELEIAAKAIISVIAYEREYEEDEPVFELYQQEAIASFDEQDESSVDSGRKLVEGCRAISRELLAYCDRHPEALHRLDPRVFEQLVGEIFSSYGFDVELNVRLPAGEADVIALGKDILGKRIGYLIECKRYSPTRRVSVGQVARLYELKRASQERLKIPYAMFVTTSDFTKDAMRFYGNRWDLDLKNRDGLSAWIRSLRENNCRPGPLQLKHFP